MKNEYLQNNLIREVRLKIPENKQLVNKLIDILLIEKEAVYRRLRKEVPFTFAEAASLSRELNISLDNLVGLDENHKRSAFQLQMTEFINAQDVDYLMMEEYINIYRLAKGSKNSEMATVSNIIPQTIYAGFPALRQFYLFKWYYHYENTGKIESYSNLVIEPRVSKAHDKQFVVSKNIAYACHILDYQLFQYLVNDIKFFYSIGLLRTEDVQSIKKDLFNLLNYLQNLAETGVYKETGNKVDFYISDLNIDSNYFYIETDTVKLCMLNAFILNSAASSDQKTLKLAKNWVQSIIRISNLITVSGGRQRILFFSEQRKIIEQLG